MNEEAYIRFESYLNNEMLEQERLDFELELRDNSELKESFELYKETTAFVKQKFSPETTEFKKNLESISDGYFVEGKKKTKVFSIRPWHYAAAASVLVLLGTWIFSNNSMPEYSDYSQHENASFVERGASNEELKNAQDFFNKKEYAKAVTAFEKMGNLDNPEYQYFYAIALIETSQYKKAETLLNGIRQGTSVYKDKATWYLALSKLKQHDFEGSKILLRQIPRDAEDYDKAQELIQHLK
ncbi:tetratricopeptide repeat protein [Flavobacterium microcysteis]|uniref:Tetratricopeptide repeat protein n=1 Tax=Flavobacterium microcysteis TaxID=2596891 RepID=A0A501Q004_9FLAO|nr:tetratricopeptide repeat protein [Flavobacterium microcysteis]TPD65336.1 tetratricopeptide repeat protein [Flavobacterium microcysteis]